VTTAKSGEMNKIWPDRNAMSHIVKALIVTNSSHTSFTQMHDASAKEERTLEESTLTSVNIYRYSGTSIFIVNSDAIAGNSPQFPALTSTTLEKRLLVNQKDMDQMKINFL
jgi:hypothetical protein